jgi:hypothetical protein
MISKTSARLALLLGLVPAFWLAGCATPSAVNVAESPWAAQPVVLQSPPATAPWHHMTFLGKAPTSFNYVRKDGRDAVGADARGSASMMRRLVNVPPDALGQIRFSWQVPALLPEADLALRDADDSPVRIVLAFEGDRSRFSPRNAMLNELARTLTGEEMPYATLMYVWCNQRAPGTVITNARTDRIRKLVVESGPKRLGQWLDYERDVRADFERAFGEAPGALVGVAIMSDTDNTQSKALAWYGPVSLARLASGSTAPVVSPR